MRKKKLKINETTIITGGCRGLGLACAEFLLSKNLHLSIIDLNSKVSSVYNETERLNNLKKKSTYVDFYYGNLANEKQVQKIISSIIKKKFKKLILSILLVVTLRVKINMLLDQNLKITI